MLLDKPSAAWKLLELHENWASKGALSYQIALAGASAQEDWRKYPRKGAGRGIPDPHIEYFWHSHPRDETPSISQPSREIEAGHFHVFFRQEPSEAAIHIIGVSVGLNGFPQALFAPNPWVTGDSVPDSQSILSSLANAAWPSKGRPAPISSWLHALLSLYQEEILAVFMERDAIIQRLSEQSQSDLYANSEWILSSQKISLLESIQKAIS